MPGNIEEVSSAFKEYITILIRALFLLYVKLVDEKLSPDGPGDFRSERIGFGGAGQMAVQQYKSV